MKNILTIILMFITMTSYCQTLIPLSTDNIINLNNKKGDANYNTNLLDEQGADPVHGIYKPVPKTAFMSGYPTHTGYPAIVVIDLKAEYSLSEIALYSKYGVDDINFEFSADGKKYSDKITYHPSGIGFFYIPVKENARYVKVYNSNKGYQKVMEVYFYGSKAAKPVKVLKTYTIELMSDSTFQVKQ